MKNLKPSQLPVHTAIDDSKYGEYLKVQDGIWEEVYSGCCSWSGRLSDDGRPSPYGDKYGLSTGAKADDMFTDFKIIAVPPGFVFHAETLHGPIIDGFGQFADGTVSHECGGYNCEKS